MSKYIVESTHSMSNPALEGREYLSINDAWMNAACDYAMSDSGLQDDAESFRNDIILLTNHASLGLGTVKLSTGEVVTVKKVDA